jgi:hypothetical protein
MRMPTAKRTGIHSDRRSDSPSRVRVSAATSSTAPLMRPRGPFSQCPEACPSRPGIADASALTFPRPYATSAGWPTRLQKGSRAQIDFPLWTGEAYLSP